MAFCIWIGLPLRKKGRENEGEMERLGHRGEGEEEGKEREKGIRKQNSVPHKLSQLLFLLLHVASADNTTETHITHSTLAMMAVHMSSQCGLHHQQVVYMYKVNIM